MNPNNVKYLIQEFQVGGTVIRVYILNPGQTFARFGGSRSGLLVRKTASLILEQEEGGTVTHTEYDVNDVQAWNRIFQVAKRHGGK